MRAAPGHQRAAACCCCAVCSAPPSAGLLELLHTWDRPLCSPPCCLLPLRTKAKVLALQAACSPCTLHSSHCCKLPSAWCAPPGACADPAPGRRPRLRRAVPQGCARAEASGRNCCHQRSASGGLDTLPKCGVLNCKQEQNQGRTGNQQIQRNQNTMVAN